MQEETTSNHEEHKGHEVEFEEISNKVIGCALEVQWALGPGLLESAYEKCLAYEMSISGIPFKSQVALPIEYKENRIDCGYRIDFLVDDALVLEIKIEIWH